MNVSTDYSTSAQGKNIRHIVPNMLQTTFTFQNYPQDLRLSSPLPLSHTLQTPGPSPALRPISSPMTPITPLVLGDPQAKDWVSPQQHEQNGYFFHHQYHPDSSHSHTIHSPVTPASQHSPSPFSSGSSTPTYANNNTVNLLNNNHNGYPPMLPSPSRPRSCPSSPTLNATNSTSIMANVHGYYYNQCRPSESQPQHQYAMVGFDSTNSNTMFQDLIIANIHNHHYPYYPQAIHQSPQQPQHYPDGVSMHDIHRLNADDMQDLMDGMCGMNIGNEAH